MMKNKLFLLFVVVFSHINAQFGSQQLITQTADGTRIIFAADVDGDANVDVLSANKFGSSLTWYKNLDGLGTFSSENLIAALNQTISASAADIDNDFDIDVIAVSGAENWVVWYENLDGIGNFSPRKIISSSSIGAFSAIAADIDGDGDNDIVLASDGSGLAWHENLDGNGNFSTTKIIDNIISNSRSVVVADMDGDGDLDVVGNGNAPDSVKIFWYENLDGLGNFGSLRVIRDFASYSNVIFVADADGDGDMDVFSASPGDSEVAWYENIDGLGTFGVKEVITNTLLDAWTVYADDLDNDGDMDVLATSVETFGGEVVWFENLDGAGSFSTKQTISTEVQSPRSVIAADLDNDGDMDVIGSSQNDDKIAWYENMTIIGIEENQTDTFKIYPNPTKGLVFISSKTENVVSVKVFDILGKNVLQQKGNIQQLDISNLQNGMYFLRIATDSGYFVQKIIKE